MNTAICIGCGPQPLENFTIDQRVGKPRSRCKDCVRAYNKAYHAERYVRKTTYTRVYGEASKERARHYARDYYATHKQEYADKYRLRINFHREREKKYRESGAAKIAGKAFRVRRKIRVMKHYGGAFCSCCGETQFLMLAMDHIHRDGAEYRKLHGKGDQTYRWIEKNNFPPIFRVLCANCNWASFHNGGICPHELEREKLIDIAAFSALKAA